MCHLRQVSLLIFLFGWPIHWCKWGIIVPYCYCMLFLPLGLLMCFIYLGAHALIFIPLVMVEEITFLPSKTSLSHCALNPILSWLHKKFFFRYPFSWKISLYLCIIPICMLAHPPILHTECLLMPSLRAKFLMGSTDSVSPSLHPIASLKHLQIKLKITNLSTYLSLQKSLLLVRSVSLEIFSC